METNYDVVVVGGGPAGIASAIAAGKNRAKTLLIEKQGFLGGTLTSGLPFIQFHNQKGTQVIRGIAEQFVERLRTEGGSLGHIKAFRGHISTLTPVDPEYVKYVAQEMLLEAGVKLLLHSFVFRAITENNKLVAIDLANKAGCERVAAKCFVDCSGDGDAAALAGASFEKGRAGDHLMQAMSIVFRMNRVDTESLGAEWNRAPACAVRLNEKKTLNIHPVEDLEKFRSCLDKHGLFPDRHHMIWCGSMRRGELTWINVTRIAKLDGSDPRQLTSAEIEGRRQMMKVVKFFRDCVPAFKEAFITTSAPQIGVRETRRILGEYVLTEEDVLSGKRFPDCIAKNAYPIDIHNPSGDGWTYNLVQSEDGTYDIPYRCLVPRKIENILVAGRCISATHEALGSTRIMACCMALGQAAGTAAALSALSGDSPRKIDMELLRGKLRSQGAYI